MRKFENVKQFVLVVFGALVAMILITALLYYGLSKTKASPQKAAEQQAAQTGLVEVVAEDPEPGQNPSEYKVPVERIPTNEQERLSSAAATLIPYRWASDPQKAMPGPEGDPVPIPTSERRKLVETMQNFLAQWETFAPAETSGQVSQVRRNYSERVSPFVSQNAISSVLERADNRQPNYICYDVNCRVGSTYQPQDLWQATSIRAYSQTEAYVTTYGMVQYSSRDPEYQDNGQFYSRSYGIVFSREGNEWKVKRAAADTLNALR